MRAPYVSTLIVALISGVLFEWLHIVLPWMLGPLVGVMIWQSIFKKPTAWPSLAKQVGLVILGYMLGTSFTSETFAFIVQDFPVMLTSTVILIGFTFLLALIVKRWTSISLNTAIMGSIPGGLSQMILLSEELKKVDPGTVALMQTLRVLLVVTVVPFLAAHQFPPGSSAPSPSVAGSSLTFDDTWLLWPCIAVGIYIGKKINLPIFPFMGTLLVTAAWSSTIGQPPAFPVGVINAAQLLLGTHLGMQLHWPTLLSLKRYVWLIIVTNLWLMGFSFGMAALWSWWGSPSLLTAFLSLAPGGVAEMGVTALAVGADLPTVTSFQLFRVLFILFCVPPFLKWWLSARRPDSLAHRS
ncbi:AbrB family transcriptional regulator [Aureibacillus halotolerans]|uniref:AbrB family transcriptional regulator n=1 Tax=Aureibacillus halotolerans TaxID=1508390 RepID=A0A4R6TTM6_9BACI|nr:AbrB family transcriptional regulator [Aureibacillus halotolerans]TDQ34130.1 hypothetical protein EV213_12727 [Aureibacillus halotolerans]